MAEQTKHDNAAVFSDMDVSDRCIATMQYDGALWTIDASISRVRRDRIDYDRVRAEVPECEGLTDVQIDWIANTIRSADILSLEQKSSCNKLVRDLTDWNSTAMTARGREVLAAIEACRVTEAEPTLTESADGRREWWLNGVRQPEPDKGGRQ